MEPKSVYFLPEPRMPLVENGSEPPEGLHPRLDQHRQAMADLRSEVGGAVQLLHDGRPGGAAWKAAQDADTDVIMSGKPLRKPALGALLAGDHDRWSVASAQCRTSTRRAATLLAELKAGRDPILSSLKIDRQALIAERRPQLADLWTVCRDGSRGRGRGLVAIEELTPLNARVALYGQVAGWLASDAAAPFKNFGGNVWPGIETDRAARIDRGFWTAAQIVTGSLILTIPDRDQIEWPDDFRDAERLKMPNSMQFGAIDSARHGGPGAVFTPDLPETARRIGALGIGAAVARPPRRGR